MSIQTSELIWRQSTERSDAGSNGGRMTAIQSVTKIKNNIWLDVPQDERTTGSIKYRKMHIHVANDDDLSLVNPRIFVETPSPGEDSVTVFPADHTDTQSSLTGSERQYGCGQLDADVSAAVTSIDVMTEDVSLDIFQDGDKIRISGKSRVDDPVGTTEYVIISGTPVYTGDKATITFTPALANGYLAANTRVSSVIEPADIETSYDGFTVTTVGTGDYDDTTYPVVLDNIGSIEQTWTLSFTSATAFNILNESAVIVGAGNTSSPATPNNPDYSKPYFTLDSAGFSGTYQSGDTIEFTTHPAAYPLWYKRIIPAGAASLTGDKVIVGIDGESSSI